jgi:hypothetical protein
VLRPEVEPPADVWPSDETLLRATLRSGRWEVTPTDDGQWVAAWRYAATNIRSTRATPEAALEALLACLQNPCRTTPLPEIEADLRALSSERVPA